MNRVLEDTSELSRGSKEESHPCKLHSMDKGVEKPRTLHVWRMVRTGKVRVQGPLVELTKNKPRKFHQGHILKGLVYYAKVLHL